MLTKSKASAMLSTIEFKLVIFSTSKGLALNAVNMMREYKVEQPVEYRHRGAEELPVKAETAPIEE
jgi:hypothetical protein